MVAGGSTSLALPFFRFVQSLRQWDMGNFPFLVTCFFMDLVGVMSKRRAKEEMFCVILLRGAAASLALLFLLHF